MLATRLNAFLDRARRDPARPAILAPDTMLNYGTLARRGAGFAARIADAAPGAVLIHGYKEADIPAAMIGALLAGRPFVFAERDAPAGRLRQIAETCDCALRIACGPPGAAIDLPTIAAADIPGADPDGLRLDPAEEARPFYVTFTSGSTGIPKGILVTRANFDALQAWFEPQNTGSAGGGGAHVNHASFAFDMSMSDMWTTLFAGRALMLLTHEDGLNPRATLRRLRRTDAVTPIGTMTATPAFFSMMLSDSTFEAAALPGLRAIWVGGEAVPRAMLRRLTEAFPELETYQAYGPSEATCNTHSQRLSAGDLVGDGSLPLGPNRSGCAALVRAEAEDTLDARGRGEVVLCGPQVTAGYLPLDHPANRAFGRSPGGQPTYATGDLGHVDADGLWIEGRIDHQIKINGFRIEPQAVEARALEVAGIEEAVLLPVGPGGTLCLFVATADGADAAPRLRAALAEDLPPYMRPRRIVAVAAMPVTGSGKVDRRALTALADAPALTPARTRPAVPA